LKEKMSGKKKHRTADEFLQYLRGDHSNQERHSFEHGMETDPFEKEALEGLEGLTPGEAETDILSLHARLRKRLARRRRIAIYSAAATVASLLIIGTIFIQIYDISPQAADETLSEKELPLITPEQEEAEETVGEAEEFRSEPEEPLAVADMSEEVDRAGAVETTGYKADDGKRDAKAPSSKKDPIVTPPPEPVKQEVFVEKKIVVMDEEIVSVEAVPVQEQHAAAPVEKSAPATEEKSAAAPEPRRMKREKSGARQMEVTGEELDQVKGGEKGMVAGSEVNLVMEPDMASPDDASLDDASTIASDESATRAEPAAGYNAFKQYIEDNIRFPDSDTATTRAVVILKFIIAANGEIRDIRPLRSPGPDFTGEATRLLIEGPSWNPASNTAGATDEEVRLRIVFKK
jgi:outer membrane biosynthesis protein TonB